MKTNKATEIKDLVIRIPKGLHEDVQNICEKGKGNVNFFIKNAIKKEVIICTMEMFRQQKKTGNRVI